LMDATGTVRRNSLDLLLSRMVTDGAIQRVGKGLYAKKDYASPAPNQPVSNNSRQQKPAASMRTSAEPTDHTTDFQFNENVEINGQSVSTCPSVASVRESTDTNGNDPSTDTKTDQTDGQMEREAVDFTRRCESRDLSDRLSRVDRGTDHRQSPAAGEKAD